MGSFVGSFKDLYFLLALVRKVQVLHRWKMSLAISEKGQWPAGLIGNHHIMEGGNVTQPVLWVTNRNQS